MSVKASRLIMLLFLFLITTIQGYSQITLNGKIEGNNEPLPFANIAIFASNDSIKPVISTLTDLNGSYLIENIYPGKYTIKISYIGYVDYQSIITLRMPSGSNTIVRNFAMATDAKNLNEVVVTANRNTVYADHTKYRFTSEQCSRARHSADLLENISDLTIDPISGNLSKLSGGNVSILINGINSSITDLKSIPANKIKYVEYYTIPSARYSNTTAVINVVTKTLDNGLNGGIDISHAITTGFFNDNIFIRAIYGKNQFVINYQINYRNYQDRFLNEDYSYYFKKNTIDYESKSHNQFGYTTHIPEIKYIYSDPNCISFQATIKPEFENKFDNSISNIIIQEDNINNTGIGNKKTNSNYFSPSLDLYISKNFKNGSELAGNIVTTYFKGDLHSSAEEIFANNNSSSFNDNMNRETSKMSLFGELFYTKRLGFNSFSIGYKSTFNHASAKGKNILTNYTESKYKSHYFSNYIYGEYSGVFNKIMYRVSIGGTLLKSSASEYNYSKFYVTPQIVLDWTLRGKHHISFNAKSYPIIPTLTQLSDNAEYVTSHLIHTGNPSLKSGISYTNILGYRYLGNFFDMTLGFTYNLDSSPIDLFYTSEMINNQEYIIAKDSNAKNFIQYGGIFSGKLSLLSDKINLRVISMALEQRLRNNDGQVTRNLYFPTFIQLAYTSQKWGISYKCNIPTNQISGSNLISDENISSLNSYFQYKNIRISASCQWFLTKAKYKEQILNNNKVKHVCNSWINDNRSMFVIGFSWNFSHGKNSDFNKKLNNVDTDNGTF